MTFTDGRVKRQVAIKTTIWLAAAILEMLEARLEVEDG